MQEILRAIVRTQRKILILKQISALLSKIAVNNFSMTDLKIAWLVQTTAQIASIGQGGAHFATPASFRQIIHASALMTTTMQKTTAASACHAGKTVLNVLK